MDFRLGRGLKKSENLATEFMTEKQEEGKRKSERGQKRGKTHRKREIFLLSLHRAYHSIRRQNCFSHSHREKEVILVIISKD